MKFTGRTSFNIYLPHVRTKSQGTPELTQQLTSLPKFKSIFFFYLREGSHFEQRPDEDKQLKLRNMKTATGSHLTLTYALSPQSSALAAWEPQR